MVQFITLRLVFFFIVCALIDDKIAYNIVKVLSIHENEPQASESTRKFDNVVIWRQLAFYLDKSLEKRISKDHFTFQKETNV